MRTDKWGGFSGRAHGSSRDGWRCQSLSEGSCPSLSRRSCPGGRSCAAELAWAAVLGWEHGRALHGTRAPHPGTGEQTPVTCLAEPRWETHGGGGCAGAAHSAAGAAGVLGTQSLCRRVPSSLRLHTHVWTAPCRKLKGNILKEALIKSWELQSACHSSSLDCHYNAL